MIEETTYERYENGNRLIDGLPDADRSEVVRHLTMMTAEEATGIMARGERIARVFFPIDALFSVLVELSGGDCYEADSVGHDGLVGGELLLGATITSRSILCQVTGRAAHMPAEAFQRCTRIPSFAAAVHRGLLLQWYRAQQTIACNFAHTLVERCARWTLLQHDAIGGQPEFPLRPEYLSMMLGVRPNVVTEPMGVLHALGAIRYTGSVVTITSEARLRDAACGCYAAPIEFAQQFEHPTPDQPPAQ